LVFGSSEILRFTPIFSVPGPHRVDKVSLIPHFAKLLKNQAVERISGS